MSSKKRPAEDDVPTDGKRNVKFVPHTAPSVTNAKARKNVKEQEEYRAKLRGKQYKEPTTRQASISSWMTPSGSSAKGNRETDDTHPHAILATILKKLHQYSTSKSTVEEVSQNRLQEYKSLWSTGNAPTDGIKERLISYLRPEVVELLAGGHAHDV